MRSIILVGIIELHNTPTRLYFIRQPRFPSAEKSIPLHGFKFLSFREILESRLDDTFLIGMFYWLFMHMDIYNVFYCNSYPCLLDVIGRVVNAHPLINTRGLAKN